AAFFRFHRGETFASSALMAPMSTASVTAVEHFLEQGQIPLIPFAKGQRKDDIAKQYHSRFHGSEGIVFVGKAQEKTPVFRTEKRRNPDTGLTYPWIVRSTAMVNHVYFYGLDEDFGPFFLKFCTYFPYTAKLCINGHEYVKRQLAKEGIAFEEVIRENLDIGRPDQVQLIFARRVTKRTPGRFRTRVLTEGVTPSLHVDYKHSRIKQYHKEGRALRTETTINDTRDFKIGKRL